MPKSAADVRLILYGKILENNKQLRDYKKEIGEVKADTLVTIHVVVRKAVTSKSAGASGKEEKAKGCGCTIC